MSALLGRIARGGVARISRINVPTFLDVWHSGESFDSDPLTGISPKPSKKVSIKGGGKRPVLGSSVLTPPESPTLRKTKSMYQ